jgi:hypothetical protein
MTDLASTRYPMSDPAADFGTGLRAHLGLEEAEREPAAEPEIAREEDSADLVVEAVAEDQEPEPNAMLETLIAFEAELLERERELARREATFAGRAGALLAAAKDLYDEVLAGKHTANDELARMRRRKSGAA